MKRTSAATAIAVALLLAICSAAYADLGTSADIDGDGVPDQVTVTLNPAGIGPATLGVRRGSNGELVSVQYDYSAGGLTDSLLKTPSLDKTPGREIIIDAQHITTNEFIQIYTMTGGTLHRAGQFFAYGSDSDYKFGITCKTSRKFRGVIQHKFKYNFSRRVLKRTNKRYVWKDGYLVRSGKTTVSTLSGKPKKSETKVAC